jgi:hypothetical protein
MAKKFDSWEKIQPFVKSNISIRLAELSWPGAGNRIQNFRKITYTLCPSTCNPSDDTIVSMGFFAPCFSSFSTVHSSAETEIVHRYSKARKKDLAKDTHVEGE